MKKKKNIKSRLKYFEGIPVIKEIKEYPNLEEEFTQKQQVFQKYKMV